MPAPKKEKSKPIKNKAKGAWQEEFASSYLQKCGYQILVRNFRCRFGEVDIIAKKNNWLIFIEVKSRKSTAYGYPEEYVGRSKLQKITTTANYFLQKYNYRNVKSRIEVVSIISNDANPMVKIISVD